MGDGGTIELENDYADRVLGAYPESFVLVSASAPAPEAHKAVKPPPEDKSIRPRRMRRARGK